MTENDEMERRLKALRTAPQDAVGPLHALVIGQTWLWQRGGLVLALLIAMVIAAMTLSPIPLDRLSAGGLDKVYHFLAFAALIFPLILTDSRRWRWAVPLAILYGGAIELIQPSVGRSAEWLDWGADITGVLAGAALAEILHDRLRARFFAVPAGGGAHDPDADARQREGMRAELMTELRAVLREELATIRRPADAGAAPADPQTAVPQAADPQSAVTRPPRGPAPATDDPRDLRH